MPFYCPTKTSARSCNCSSMKARRAVKDLSGSTHFLCFHTCKDFVMWGYRC